MMLVLDDHPIARQGLESVIRMCRPDEEIIQAGTVKEAVQIADSEPITMAFVDINLGKESGFDFLRWVRDNQKDIKVFFITSSSRESDFFYARNLGVDAYVLKDAFIDEIMYGIKVVERGGRFYSAVLVDQIDHFTEEERVFQGLTNRELEVLELLSQGYSNVKISQSLFISEATVKKHITSILGKLGVKNRVEAVLFANRNRAIMDNLVAGDLANMNPRRRKAT